MSVADMLKKAKDEAKEPKKVPDLPREPKPKREKKKFPKYWDIVAWIKDNPDKVTEKTLRKAPEKWKGIIQTILTIAEDLYLS